MQKNLKTNLNEMVRAAVLIAIGIILPLFFHTIKNAGSIFLPMHIPVLIGGFILSPAYAVSVGILSPLLSHLFTGMPPFPFVFVMIFELAAYGFFTSLLYNKIKLGLYPSLISAMLLGRIVNILGVYFIIHLFMGKQFKLSIVLSGLFLKGLPGIIIQLLLIPLIIKALNKSSLFDSRG